MKSSIIPKIGKRGWLGVVLFAIGALTFFGAYTQAETEMELSNDSLDEKAYKNAVAKEAGYNSFTDALAIQNRNSGTFFMCVGASLVVWGYRRHRVETSDGQKSQK